MEMNAMTSDMRFTAEEEYRTLNRSANGDVSGEVFTLFDKNAYPEVCGGLIDEANRRGRAANDAYRMACHRAQMFASGMKAGMYIARFDENEQMTGFSFTDEMREMLGYDGLGDLPDEFESWLKALVPEDRESMEARFWNAVKHHREQQGISHVEFRMMKKDGSIIWVACAGEFICREDGSLETYMGCYREVTAEYEREAYLHIVEGVGKVFDFSIYIDIKSKAYWFISAEAYAERGRWRQDAFAFLQTEADKAAAEHRESLRAWLSESAVLEALEKNNVISRDYYSEAANVWYKSVFLVSDRNENGEIAHVIYGHQNINATKKKEESLIQKSQTDELTGAYNRRAYEECAADLEKNPLPEEFVYISVDVNGLKTVNDTIGHNAGDELIIGACTCLQRSLGQFGNVYRMGGDEFTALINADEDLLRVALEALDTAVDRWTGNLVEQMSISYGFVTRKEADGKTIREIAIMADKKMYQAKAAFYSKRGINRRGQVAAHIALCKLYTKILKINITEDSYQIINMDLLGQEAEAGISPKISEWLFSFGSSDQVHPDDQEAYLNAVGLENMRRYFKRNKTSLHIFYRRRYGEVYKQVMMEIIPAEDYSTEDQRLYLYVKDIDR